MSFLKLVVIANVIGWPIAFWAMTVWLGKFAYRVELGPGIFQATGALTATIAQLTILYHVGRVAIRNPVESLRHE